MNGSRIIIVLSFIVTAAILAVKPYYKKQLIIGKITKNTRASMIFDELPLPKSLSNLPHVTIRHIKATQQTGCQCGSRSVANALAVQDLVYAKQALTAGNIRSQANHYNHILINRVIDDYELAQLALKNNLQNAHIVCRNTFKDATVWPFIVTSIETWSNSIETISTRIKNEPTILIQLICNTGGHWVLLSIIKNENCDHQILYMDSSNNRLNESSWMTSCIKYVYTTFFL
jgi:hypothetical protein